MRKLLSSLHARLRLKGWVVLCLLAAGALALPPVLKSRFVAQRRAELAVRQAQAHLASHAFDAARAEFRTALRFAPGDLGARRQLADMELALGNEELAFLEYESLSEMHPEDPDAWVKLAGLMLKSGQLEAPEAALDRAVNLDTQRADARLARGDIRFRLGRYYAAREDARAAVTATPKDVAAWVLLVQSAARSQGPEVGIQSAKEAIAAAGEAPPLVAALASLLAQSGRMAEAQALLQREISSSTQQPDRARSARLALARIELSADNPAGARTALETLLKEVPPDGDAVALRAAMDAQAGRVEEALADLDGALAAHPDANSLRSTRARLLRARNDGPARDALLADLAARNLGPLPAPPRRLRADAQTGRGNLGAWTREHWPGRLAETRQTLEAALQAHDWAEAQRIIDGAAVAFPGSAVGPYLSGVLELARGRLDEAERKLSEALAIAPRLPTILAALGRTWSLRRGAGFAGEQLMRLATADPGLSLARYMAARAYIEAHDPLRAEAALTRGLQLQPDSPMPYQHLTDYYFGLDRAAEALDICRRGLERFPQDTDLQMMLAQIDAGTGQPQEAIRVYDELESKRPDLDLAQYKRATLLANETGEESHRKFLAAIGQLKGDMPSDPLLLDALGWMHYRAQDVARARVLLDAAAKGAPEEPSVHYHLARVYAQQKEVGLETQELKTALASPRPFPERIEAMRLLRQDEGGASQPRASGNGAALNR